MINKDYKQGDGAEKAVLDSLSCIDYSEYLKIQDENFQLKQSVEAYSQNCFIEDTLQKENASE